ADASAAINVLSSAVEKGAAAERPQFPAPSFLDDAPVEAPVFPPARYADAAALLTQGKYAEAVASFRASSASDPLVTDRALRS
ncbi:hypothetical protein, partial [Salmonella sp. SAL4443]|uniref:hypothetical protein n=1 Tax=Salmonella sp. SAL4443 TaxID=3159898 RepID=UPI003978AE8F